MKTTNFLLLMLSLCLLGAPALAQTSKPYVEGTWKIKTLKDSGKMLDLAAKETTVTINTKGKSILAYVGCNRMTAAFEFITADIIKPFQLQSTRKACKEGVEGLESATRYVLEQTNSVRKNGARIEFFKDNELLMVLERPATDVKKKKK
jgi:heat shock protein HslJ